MISYDIIAPVQILQRLEKLGDTIDFYEFINLLTAMLKSDTTLHPLNLIHTMHDICGIFVAINRRYRARFLLPCRGFSRLQQILPSFVTRNHPPRLPVLPSRLFRIILPDKWTRTVLY